MAVLLVPLIVGILYAPLTQTATQQPSQKIQAFLMKPGETARIYVEYHSPGNLATIPVTPNGCLTYNPPQTCAVEVTPSPAYVTVNASSPAYIMFTLRSLTNNSMYSGIVFGTSCSGTPILIGENVVSRSWLQDNYPYLLDSSSTIIGSCPDEIMGYTILNMTNIELAYVNVTAA